MSKSILIVGCGQLGSRHLQAVASMPQVSLIQVLDPNPASLAMGKSRLGEARDINPLLTVSWLSRIEEVNPQVDLCIIATLAKGRLQLVRAIAGHVQAKNFMVEKVVCQSLAEYKELMGFAAEKRLNIWVNCKTRAYAIHQYIKTKLDPKDPVIFSFVGGNDGLGTCGIHEADLFMFYDGGSQIHLKDALVDNLLHPSKRGADIFELSGTLIGHTDKGSRFQVTFMDQPMAPDILTILTPRSRFIIDHFKKFALESYEHRQWEWTTVPIEENWMVSHMSKQFAADILDSGQCRLPTLNDCWPAHEFISNALTPHFNRLLNKNLDYCPIT